MKAKVPSEKIWLLPPGREVEKYLLPMPLSGIRREYELAEEDVVLYVGRVTAEKGIDILLKAFKILTHEMNISAQLVVAGPESFDSPGNSSPYIASLISLARESGVTDRIRFTGPLPTSDLVKMYNLCAVFVLPSRRETFGSVLTEAMAAGKPVIATRTAGAMMQVRDGWNGYLVDIGDYHALALRIAAILGNREEQKRMGVNALEAAKVFGWDAIIRSYTRMIETSLQCS